MSAAQFLTLRLATEELTPQNSFVWAMDAKQGMSGAKFYVKLQRTLEQQSHV